MELNGAKILYTIHTDIPLLGDLKITQTLVTTWIVMALLSGLAIWLGSNLKLENVSKRQAAAEFIVERLDQFVHDNMGYHFDTLNAAKALGGTPVVFLHYPPAYDTAQCRELLDTMQAYGVKECYYGHIHGDHAAKKAPLGEYGGIKMHLVSCDYIRFTPKLVRKDAEIG